MERECVTTKVLERLIRLAIGTALVGNRKPLSCNTQIRSLCNFSSCPAVRNIWRTALAREHLALVTFMVQERMPLKTIGTCS